MYFELTLKLVVDGPTDRPTDIVTYRAAIAAKNQINGFIFKDEKLV